MPPIAAMPCLIEVEDDGAGSRYREDSRQSGRAGTGPPGRRANHLPEAEAIKFIFLPGFSTADQSAIKRVEESAWM